MLLFFLINLNIHPGRLTAGTRLEPENDGFASDDFSFPGVYSQVDHVNLPECI